MAHKIILIEGFDGSGKSKLADNLRYRLGSAVVFRDPVDPKSEMHKRWKALYDVIESEDERALLWFIQHLQVAEKTREFIYEEDFINSDTTNTKYVIIDRWWVSTLVYNHSLYTPVFSLAKQVLFPVDLLVLCEASLPATNARLEARGKPKVDAKVYENYTQSYRSWLDLIVEEGMAAKTVRVDTDKLSEGSSVAKVLKELGLT